MLEQPGPVTTCLVRLRAVAAISLSEIHSDTNRIVGIRKHHGSHLAQLFTTKRQLQQVPSVLAEILPFHPGSGSYSLSGIMDSAARLEAFCGQVSRKQAASTHAEWRRRHRRLRQIDCGVLRILVSRPRSEGRGGVTSKSSRPVSRFCWPFPIQLGFRKTFLLVFFEP